MLYLPQLICTIFVNDFKSSKRTSTIIIIIIIIIYVYLLFVLSVMLLFLLYVISYYLHTVFDENTNAISRRALSILPSIESIRWVARQKEWYLTTHQKHSVSYMYLACVS